MSSANILTIINPDDGKRYRLNIKGEIARLTVGRLKQCLASASTCPIPVSEQVLKLNGTSLSNDEDTCAVYGITRGSTLTVEYRENMNPAALNPVSFVSPRRRALEYQTIRLQESALSEDVLISEDVLHAKIERLQNELQSAEHRKTELERSKARADRELDSLRQQEALTAQEQQRIIYLRQQEAERAARRAADLAARRERLKAEENSVRAVAMQKLENERRKAELEQQRAIYEAEKERLEQERKAYDQRAKERETKIREKEMELEQQMLAAERDKRELDFNRFVSHQNRAQYYNRMGLAVPPELLSQSQNQEVEWVASQDGSRSAPRASGIGIGIGIGSGNGNDVSTPRRGIPQPLRSQPRPAALLSSEADTTTASEHMRHHMGVNSSLPIIHPSAHGKDMYDVHENALANLRCMEDGLALDHPLHFDANNTCVISIDGQYTLLVTFDATTERLYVYSTLLASIPTDPETRMRVYEFLMEGALLGREMCGGGVGASVKNDFILMSTSIYLPTSHPTTLRVVTPLFVQCLNVWRKKLQEFLDELEPVVPQAQQQQQQKQKQKTQTQTPPSQQQQHQQQRRPQPQPQQKLLQIYSDLLSVPQERRAHSPKDLSVHSGPSRSGASAAASHAVVGIEATDSVPINGVTSRYDAGVLVVNVTGPAAHAGIQIHDFIKKVDGHDVTNLIGFQQEVARLVPGAAVPFVVERGGQMIVVTVKAAAAA